MMNMNRSRHHINDSENAGSPMSKKENIRNN